MQGGSELLRRQNAEKLDLERKLREEEQQQVDRLSNEHAQKRAALMQDLESKLNSRLSRTKIKLKFTIILHVVDCFECRILIDSWNEPSGSSSHHERARS